MLAEGMCIFHGPSEDTVPYLASVGLHCPMYNNPADYSKYKAIHNKVQGPSSFPRSDSKRSQ